MNKMRKMTRDERITEVIKGILTSTEVEYLVKQFRNNSSQRSIDELFKLYTSAKHTFRVLMM